jgi:hypothetical protein
MLRELQRRVDDLAERLLICELELFRARNLDQRIGAFWDLSDLVVRIEALRIELETIHRGQMVTRLVRKVASITRSEPYKEAAWFATQEPSLCWMICPLFSLEGQLQPH